MDKYLNQALQLGFKNAALLPVEKLVYIKEYRKYCEENICGSYDLNPACPPKCGTPEDMRERMIKYTQALILQTELKLPKFDYEKYLLAKKDHNVLAEKLMYIMKADGITDQLFMAAGPWKNHSCMSAYCIDAQKMADMCGMICWENDGIVRLFSLILVK